MFVLVYYGGRSILETFPWLLKYRKNIHDCLTLFVNVCHRKPKWDNFRTQYTSLWQVCCLWRALKWIIITIVF